MLPRDRVANVLDPGSPFLELGVFAGHGMYDGAAPGGGAIAGVGRVHGRDVMVVCNDATVKGGTYYPITVKKHLRAQEIAEECRLPCIYLVDSGGANLPNQDEVFPDRDHFGRIFYNQARMSAKGIAQVAVVMGSCTAGGAYVPAMSDVSPSSSASRGRSSSPDPPLVKAATGEVVTAEDLGGGDVHTRLSGVADYLAEDDAHALALAREIVRNLEGGAKGLSGLQDFDPPAYDPEEILSVVPADLRTPYDIREVIARLVDGSRLRRVQGPVRRDARDRVRPCSTGCRSASSPITACCFRRRRRRGRISSSSARQRRIPLVFLQNITGFMVGRRYENEGIARHGAKMVTAVATTSVPKVTMLVGGSFGAGNYGMAGRAYQPRFLWTWPNSRIAVMGGPQAAGVLATVKREGLERLGQEWSAEDEAEFRRPTEEMFARQSHPLYASARLWDDGIIDPRLSRDVLALSLRAALNAPVEETRFGVFRM